MKTTKKTVKKPHLYTAEGFTQGTLAEFRDFYDPTLLTEDDLIRWAKEKGAKLIRTHQNSRQFVKVLYDPKYTEKVELRQKTDDPDDATYFIYTAPDGRTFYVSCRIRPKGCKFDVQRIVDSHQIQKRFVKIIRKAINGA